MSQPPSLPRVALRDGLLIDLVLAEDVARRAEMALDAAESLHIVTVNPEIVVASRRRPAFRRILDQSEIRTADGIGVAFVAGLRARRWWRRLTGGAVVDALTALSARRGFRLTVLGAMEASRVGAEDELARRGASIVRGWSGQVADDGNGIQAAAALVRAGTIALVALGTPKADFAIHRLRLAGAGPAVYVSVGGVIDYLSDTVPVPPAIIRSLGLEWAFRLALDPRTRARRQLALPRFILQELGLWA